MDISHLNKIKEFNLQPAYERILAIIDDLAMKKSMLFQGLDGLVFLNDTALEKLKKQGKNNDFLVQWLQIEYEIQLANDMIAWIIKIHAWIEEMRFAESKEDIEKLEYSYLMTLQGQVEFLSQKSLLSMDHRLQSFVQSHVISQDLIHELINSRLLTSDVDDDNYSLLEASRVFQDLNQELSNAKVTGFLARYSTLFFLSTGLFLLVLYFSK